MDEFALIRRYFAGLTAPAADVVLGVGDDCALLRVPPDAELAVTTDTLIAGRHFPTATEPYDIGWKALAVNLSDLAAMGAHPRWFTLCVTLETANQHWLEGFSRGLRDLALREGVSLVGGDTTRGPLSITITAMGHVPRGSGLRRDRAQIGDAVCVTGTLGDAALALRALGVPTLDPSLRQRLDRPEPRVAAGRVMRDLAHAAIDLSDGLAGDLSHLLSASGVGAVIDLDALPMSDAFASRAGPLRHELQTAGGDDYELCVCLPSARVEAARAQLDIPLTVIGQITTEPGLRFVDASGATIALPPHGYRHFE